MKRISFPIQNVGDTFKSIGAENIDESILSAISSSQGRYWLQADGDGNYHLCLEVNDSVTSLSAVFNNGSEDYTVEFTEFETNPAGFVGSRPTRPTS